MKISIIQKENCSVIEPQEDVLLHNSQEFKNHINTILEKHSSDIIINLSNIRYADSALIASLIFASKKAQLKGKECVLINVEYNVLKILKISNIDSYFKIYNNAKECVLKP
jgi:anti-sigma B factor antagonist